MVQGNGRISISKGRLALGPAFFLFCYVYLWIVVKPHLIYHGFGTLIPHIPVFATGWPFLRDSLVVPGGLALYAHGLLSQGYYHSWLGALLIVLAALCLCELSRRHYIYAGHPDSTALSLFPAAMIVLIYNHYDHPLAACLTSSVALLFSLAFERIPIRRGPIRMAVFCLMAAICYWLAGAGGVFVFSLMTIIYLLFLRCHWVPAALTLPIAVAVIWVLSEYVFHVSPKQAFLVLTPLPELTADVKMLSKVLTVMLYAFVPATVLLIFLWRTFFTCHPSRRFSY